MKKFKLIDPEVRIEPTNMCNGNCIMCPREKMTRPQGILNMKLYKKIVDQIIDAEAKYICLENYGEPFLDPTICEKAEYAKSKGLKVFTLTNASLLDEKKCKEVIKSFDVIRISMYAATKNTYERIHGGLNFEEVKRNIARLFKMRKNNRIEMYFLFMEENKLELEKWLGEYEKIADGVSVWKPHNWADGRAYRRPKGKKISCNRPFSGPVQIQWDGLVVPCCFDYDGKIILGDLKKQTLHEILTGEKYNDLRCAHRKGEFYKYPLCNICDQLDTREDILIYTNIKKAKVRTTNSIHYDLANNKKSKSSVKASEIL